MLKIALHMLSWIVERWWPGLQLDPRPRAARHSGESPPLLGAGLSDGRPSMPVRRPGLN